MMALNLELPYEHVGPLLHILSVTDHIVIISVGLYPRCVYLRHVVALCQPGERGFLL